MASVIQGAVPPPTGVISHFDNPSPLHTEIVATVILCLTLTTIFTAARLLAKRTFSPWTLEDYILMIAWAGNVVLSSLTLVQDELGMGRHLWDLTVPDIIRLSHMSWIVQLLYGPVSWLAKTALLVQLMRVFTPNKSGPVYWTIHALVWGNCALYAGIFFASAFECSPHNQIWMPHVARGKCLERNVIFFVTAPTSAFSNLLILLLPIWAVWHLQLELKRKLWITAIFATGVSGVVASIFRLVYTVRLCFYDSDVPYVAAQARMWYAAEMAAIILCTCFPMMPRLIIWILSKQRTPRSHSHIPLAHHQHAKTRSVLLADAGIGQDVAKPEAPYAQIEEQDVTTTEWWNRYTGPGIQKTVSIELTRHHAAVASRGSPTVMV